MYCDAIYENYNFVFVLHLKIGKDIPSKLGYFSKILSHLAETLHSESKLKNKKQVAKI
jgi:hypothetical protein